MLVEFSLRRAVKFRHIKAGFFLVELFKLRELGFKFGVGKLCHVLVVRRMIADEMAFLRHAYNKLRVSLNQIVEHEKRAGRVVLFQNVEDPFHVPVFIAGVKGEIDALFLGVFPEKNTAVFGYKRHLRLDGRADVIFLSFAIPALRRSRRGGRGEQHKKSEH